VRPRIAITLWRRELPTFVGERTLLYTLADEYVRSVVEAGGLPVLIPHLRDEREADAILDGVDGVLIAGGGDLDPSSYGAEDAGSYDVDAAADASEIALARRAMDRRVPTLAICRGMQILAVANGGRLRQEICAPGSLHEPMSADPAAVLGARHPVTIAAGSRLAEALGAGERVVNTIHHQALERVPDGFHVTAEAPDGTIEAIEPLDPSWSCIAVQWHPEKMEGVDAPLFEAFVAAVDADRDEARTPSR
jgi:putative glutamine amidotransferase